MAEGYEFAVFHCYEHGEFRVRKKSGEIGLQEPCPTCKALCVRAMPFALDLELSSKCNARCVMCPRGKDDFSRKIGDMSGDTFMHILEEIRLWNKKQPHTVRWMWLHMFGESIAHSHFVEWTNALADAGVDSLAVSTNAMPLNSKLAEGILASKLHRLIISLDGVSRDTYESIRRGAKFEIVRDNVDNLLKVAGKRAALGRRIPQIWIQILKLDANQHEWLAMVRKYTQNPRIRAISPRGRQYRDIPGVPGGRVFCKSVERFGGQYDAEQNKGWDGAKNRRLTCKKPWERLSVWWDGTVPSPACCYTANSDEMLGSVADGKNSLHGIWLGPRFQKVREEFTKYQNSKGKEGILPELCRNC